MKPQRCVSDREKNKFRADDGMSHEHDRMWFFTLTVFCEREKQQPWQECEAVKLTSKKQVGEKMWKDI